jgi:germination protein M
MARMGRKFPGFGVIAALALVGFVGAAAVAFYVASGSGRATEPEKARPAATRRPTITLVSERRDVTVYLPERYGKRVYLAPVVVKAEVRGSLMDSALRALFAEGTTGGRAAGLIPDGTKLLTAVKTDGDVAEVNLSREFLDNFSGGSDQEALTLNSIVHTLVHNSGGKVGKVRLLVEGETVESLGGHFELTDPVEADSTLLRPRD